MFSHPLVRLLFILVIFCALSLIFTLWRLNHPPTDFKATAVAIPSGSSVMDIANILEADRVIKSAKYFYLNFRYFYPDTKIQAGRYKFDQPLTTLTTADQLANNLVSRENLSLTFPEGYSTKRYAEIIPDTLPDFPVDRFLSLSQKHEGYLWPDTYFVDSDLTPEKLITLLRTRATEKLTGFSITD